MFSKRWFLFVTDQKEEQLAGRVFLARGGPVCRGHPSQRGGLPKNGSRGNGVPIGDIANERIAAARPAEREAAVALHPARPAQKEEMEAVSSFVVTIAVA